MTTKLHISLVGGQTAPVYQGTVYANPDKLILVHSTDTLEQAKRIQSEIAFPVDLLEFDPVDIFKIFQKIDILLQQIDEQTELSINLSSGTKPWALAFYSKFVDKHNAEIFYVDQNARIWDFKTLKSVEAKFDIDAQFRLYGNPLNNYKRLADYTDDDFKILTVVEELRSFNFFDFNKLVTEFEEKSIVNLKLNNGSSLVWHKQERKFEMSLVYKSKLKTMQLYSPHIRDILLNSGWMELKVAKILSKWNKINEIRLNCVFPTKDNSPKNEIDIIADIGSKLLFVECKTHLKRETDIDKFASAVRNYGGMASKAILITQQSLNQKAIEKCSDNGIMYFSLDSDSQYFSTEDLLISLLETQLLNINPR